MAPTTCGPRPPCSCSGLAHKPTDCPYPAGCTGCICVRPAHHPTPIHCEHCGEFTVHPDQHTHDPEIAAREGADADRSQPE